jgi:hypothetical protein
MSRLVSIFNKETQLDNNVVMELDQFHHHKKDGTSITVLLLRKFRATAPSSVSPDTCKPNKSAQNGRIEEEKVK